MKLLHIINCKNSLVVLMVGLFLIGCRDKISAPEFGFEYFGWEEGSFRTYEVTEIFHDINLNPKSDTTRYVLKTVVGEPVTDNQGRLANKFFRYTYDIETGGLIDQRVWRGIIADSRGELVEENQRVIRLVFAITPSKKWNIHAFNSNEEQMAEYQNIHQEKNLENFSFDSTVTVLYRDFFSLVDYRKLFDVYAKGVGLVQRSYKDLAIQNFDTLDISIGTETHYKLIDYGFE